MVGTLSIGVRTKIECKIQDRWRSIPPGHNDEQGMILARIKVTDNSWYAMGGSFQRYFLHRVAPCEGVRWYGNHVWHASTAYASILLIGRVLAGSDAL